MLRTFSPWRLRAIGWVLTVSFLVAAGRLYYLHVIANPKLQQISEQNRIRLETRPAKRGQITDINGELIATHQTRIVVGVDPMAFKEWGKGQDKLPKVAAALNMPLGQLQEALESDKRWVKLKEGVNESAYKDIENLKLKGFYGYPSYDRIYPKSFMAAHAVGFLNKEGVATCGVEKMMDFYLKGQEGWRETERDGRRRELGQFRSREVPPSDGYNVELTIDLRVQNELEEQMKEIVAKYSPDGASIIASDPKTGFILGMTNYPTFDPNNFAKSSMEAMRNRAISDLMEPGSTFKVVPVSGALEEGIVTPESVFDCAAPTAMRNGIELKLPRDHETYHNLTVREIIAKSSNRGAAQVGLKMGEAFLYKYARAYGYGQTTGLGLVGEAPGILMPVKHWDGLTITRLPMGHAVAATPLQVHCAISSIANDGVLMQPQLVKRVYDVDGHTVLEFKPRPRRQVVSVQTARTMAQMMVKTVSPEGTAEKAQIPGYEVAGKTGTTQKLENGHYSTTHHIASFSGFFPARNPQLAVTVIIDHPRSKGVGYGGLVSAPAFKAIATRLIQHLAIAPVEPTEVEKSKKK